MAETITPRAGVRQWSAGTDTVSRTDFNETFANIEDRMALDDQGVHADRPAPGIRGRYWYSTDQKIHYRDTGSAWEVLGGNTLSAKHTATNVSTPAAILQRIAGQSSDILRLINESGQSLSSFTSNGGLKMGGVYITSLLNESVADRIGDASLSAASMTKDQPAAVFRGAANQATNIVETRLSSNAVVSRVDSAGVTHVTSIRKVVDTDPTTDAEYTTRGYVKRAMPTWKIANMSQAQYDALTTKDANTLYIIT